MAVVKCAHNHYYDDSKYDQCPHCIKNGESALPSMDIGENKTVAKYKSPPNVDNALQTQSLRSAVKQQVDSSQKTVAKYFSEKNFNPIAGWLVCVQGENRGRSFEIHVGKNFVGRSMKSDIHTNDEKVSRENHFSVIYEPLHRDFFVLQGNGITYYNDNILSDAEKLSEGDTIEAGSSKYVFVPYCKEGRDWND